MKPVKKSNWYKYHNKAEKKKWFNRMKKYRSKIKQTWFSFKKKENNFET